jgi:hypothetical protein
LRRALRAKCNAMSAGTTDELPQIPDVEVLLELF